MRELDTRRRPGGGPGLAARRHRTPQRRTRTAALDPRHPPPARHRRNLGPVPQDQGPADHRTADRGPQAAAGMPSQPAWRISAAPRPGPARRRRCGVAGGDAGQPRRPSTHRTRPTPKGRPHLAATPRHTPSPARTPPPCRNGARSSPRPDARRARDTFLPVLAERLAAISRSGINAAQLLHTAINTGPLPDEHGAAALWWRISRHLQPAVTASAGHDDFHHHPLGRPADRAGRRRPGPPAPAQPPVAGPGVGGRPRPAARLAPRTAPHPRHVAPRRRRMPGAGVADLPAHRPRARRGPRRTRRPPIRASTSNRNASQPHRASRSQATDQPIRISASTTAVATARRWIDRRTVEDRWVEADLAVAAMVRTAGLRLEQTDTDVKRMIDPRRRLARLPRPPGPAARRQPAGARVLPSPVPRLLGTATICGIGWGRT